MQWSSFWSAVIGGVLVIAGHVVVHVLQRHSQTEDKKAHDDREIATLVLGVVNWLEMDKQAVILAAGRPMESIKPGNPIHALVGMAKVSRPDLND